MAILEDPFLRKEETLGPIDGLPERIADNPKVRVWVQLHPQVFNGMLRIDVGKNTHSVLLHLLKQHLEEPIGTALVVTEIDECKARHLGWSVAWEIDVIR